MSCDVLVVVEHNDGRLKNVSIELLNYFGKIAKENGVKVIAFVFGDHITEKLYCDIGKLGIPQIVSCVDNDLDVQPGLIASMTINLAKKFKPKLIAMANTVSARDSAPLIAQGLDIEMYSDVIDIDYKKTVINLTRLVYGGKAMEKIKLLNQQTLITIRPNVLGNHENEAFIPKITKLKTSELSDAQTYIIKAKITKEKAQKPINEAEVIIAIGRGLRRVEDLNMVDDLARVVDGVIGSTRPVVDMGFVRRSHQIGQSGRSVSPRIAILLGISGQIQFVAGISKAKTIIAVNKDAKATIFKSADYGIVGDIYAIIPILTRELKKLKLQNR
jgi:electron transfer flavoprotein alpha subunit